MRLGFSGLFSSSDLGLGTQLTNRLNDKEPCAYTFEEVRVLGLAEAHIGSFAGNIKMSKCDGDKHSMTVMDPGNKCHALGIKAYSLGTRVGYPWE